MELSSGDTRELLTVTTSVVMIWQDIPAVLLYLTQHVAVVYTMFHIVIFIYKTILWCRFWSWYNLKSASLADIIMECTSTQSEYTFVVLYTKTTFMPQLCFAENPLVLTYLSNTLTALIFVMEHFYTVLLKLIIEAFTYLA